MVLMKLHKKANVEEQNKGEQVILLIRLLSGENTIQEQLIKKINL